MKRILVVKILDVETHQGFLTSSTRIPSKKYNTDIAFASKIMEITPENKEALALILNHLMNSWLTSMDIIIGDDECVEPMYSSLLIDEDLLTCAVLRTVSPCLISFVDDNPSIFRGEDHSKTRECVKVLMKMDSERFRRHMRLNKNTYDFIVGKIAPSQDRANFGPGKPRLSSIIQVGSTLR